MNLHRVPYKPIFVHLLKDEQKSETYRAINPSLSVPTLVVHKTAHEHFIIPQSMAALQYIEEVIPPTSPHHRPLLPNDPERRAVVHSLVAIIVADTQPITNLRVQRWVKELGADPTALSRRASEAGFSAYEALASTTAGVFSVGDDITLADVVLVPAVWSAARIGIDLQHYPTIARVVNRMEQEPAVKEAHWTNQPDTPDEFRHN